MNTAENLFDGSHGTLIDALETAKRLKSIDAVGRGPNTGVAPRCSAVRLPVIHVPRLSWWQCTRLNRLGFPPAETMVSELVDAASNADETVALALDQIVQSSFAPELCDTLYMYLAYEGTPDIYDPMRVSQVYTLFVYVTGTADFAQAIQQIVPMTDDIKAIRARIAMA